jgi:CBS domain-containing protein
VLVVNDQGIVFGRVKVSEDSGVSVDGTAEDAMQPGPATVRANEPLEPLLERMAKRGVTEIVVSTPEGQLLGVVRRDP